MGRSVHHLEAVMAVTAHDVDAGAVGRRMTLDEFLKLPETEPASEYADGVVIQKVAPQGQHVFIQADFLERVNAFARPAKLARAVPELRTTYAGLSRVPDVAVYAWDRIPRLPNGEVANHFTEPPDIAVEVVSPGQSVTDLVDKCIWYVKNGVRIALIVDIDRRVVFRFRSDAVPDALRGEDRIDLDEVLPGFELTVSQLFGSLIVD
jgi:Uma2 family endonuclease